MIEETKEQLELRQLKALVDKAEYEAKSEAAKYHTPWFRSDGFVKSIVAGFTFAIGVAAYAQFIFLPQENELIAQKIHSDFTLIELTKQYETEMTKLGFLQQVALSKFDLSQQAYSSMKISFENEKKENDQFILKLDQIEVCEANNDQVIDIAKILKERNQKLDLKIAKVEEDKVSIEAVTDVLLKDTKEFEVQSGWIYIGYQPSSGWDYRTIEINPNEDVIEGTEYTLNTNVILRGKKPNFTIFGYKFGNSMGYLDKGQKIILIDVVSVGRNKIWANVKTIKGDK